MATGDLKRVEAAFAKAALGPSLWTKALDVVTAETEGFGALLLPRAATLCPTCHLQRAWLRPPILTSETGGT
jgi:hypothetical protein